MAQRILDIVSEYPEIEHVSEYMQEPSVEKHGRKKGQDGGDQRFALEHFAMGDLIRNGSPKEDKLLTRWKA